MSAKDWAAAITTLEKIAQLAPDVAEVQANLGLAYYSANRISSAAEAFERALKLNPKMPQARVMLGLCDAEMGKSADAVRILEPAFRSPPDRELGRLIGLDLSRAYAALHQDDKALAVSEELLKRYPDDPEIIFTASQQAAERSAHLMSRLLRLDPDSAWVHYAQAEIHESSLQYDLAIAEYRKVLEKSPGMPGIHYRIGRCRLAKSRAPESLDAALQEFQAELQVAPSNAEAEYEIGEIYRERNKFDVALEHFTRATQFHQAFFEAQIGLARSLISLGRQREALLHLQGAVQLDPKNEIPHYLLASIYRALGDSAAQQKEMAIFQKLHAAASVAVPSVRGPASSQVSEQKLDQ